MNTQPVHVTAPIRNADILAVRSTCGHPDRLKPERNCRVNAELRPGGLPSSVRPDRLKPERNCRVNAELRPGGLLPCRSSALGRVFPRASASSRRTCVAHPRRSDRTQGGYVTLFVLSIATAIFLALGAAMQANSCLREANRRQAQGLQTRAAQIAVWP